MSNGKYMDFVPKGARRSSVKPAGKPAAGAVAARSVGTMRSTDVAKSVGVAKSATGARPVTKSVGMRPVARPMAAKSATRPATARPMAAKSVAGKPVAARAVVLKPVSKSTQKPVSESAQKSEAKKLKLEDYRKKFVNLEKIKKRPLSKNVYQKKVVVEPVETPSGPVTIIDKPEKDSKVGLVVTIIITIILGAAAGTVAFLLLPK